MSYEIFKNPWIQYQSGSSSVYAGAKLTFYETGTTTKQDTYSDSALTTPNTNPVIADSAGYFSPIYLDQTKTYKAVLSSSDDVELYSSDPANFDYAAEYGARVNTVDTLALLKSETNTDYACICKGRTSAGDGYEGIFVYDSSDLSTEVSTDTVNGIYVPPNSDASGASGAWVRVGKQINVKFFGAIGNGSTDDTLAIQAAIDYAADIGGGEVIIPEASSYYLHSRPFMARSNVTVRVENESTRFVNDNSYGEYWSGASWMLCPLGMGVIETSETSYSVASISVGSQTTTFNTAGDSANFSAGDVVMIYSNTYYVVGTHEVPNYVQFNKVESVGTGTITCKYPHSENVSGLQVRNLSNFVSKLSGTLAPVGVPSASNFKLYGGAWETDDTAYFCTQMVGIDNEMHIYSFKGRGGVAYGSGGGFSKFSVMSETVLDNSVDAAYGMHDTTIDKHSVVITNHTKNTQCVLISESGRNVRLNIGYLSIVGAPTVSSLIRILSSKYCKINIDYIRGTLTAGHLTSFESLNYTGTVNSCVNNDIKIGYSKLTNQTSYCSFINSTSDVTMLVNNVFEGNCYGDCSSAAATFGVDTFNNVLIGRLESGAVVHTGNSYNNNASRAETTITRRLKAINHHLGPTSLTGTPKTYTLSKSIPATTLGEGCEIVIKSSFYAAGTTATKNYKLTIAGSDVLNLTIPTGTLQCRLDGIIVIQDTTQGYFDYVYYEGSTPTHAIVYFGSKNFTTTDYFITLYMEANAADTFALRNYDIKTYKDSIDVLVRK